MRNAYSNLFRGLSGTVWLATAALAQEGPSGSEEPKDPIVILRRASDAAKAAKVVRYKTTVQPFGTMTPAHPRFEGTVTMSGWRTNQPEKYVYDATAMSPDGTRGKRITLGCNGEDYFLIDHEAKKAYRGKSYRVFGSHQDIFAHFPVVEWVQPRPFEAELVSGGVELKGTTKVGDEDCYELLVRYPGRLPQESALWFFSKKDHLLRRLDWVNDRGGGNRRGRQVMLTNIELDPKSTEDLFVLQVPKGYETIDGNAP